MLIKWTDQNLEDWINGISLIVCALTQDTHARINKYVWFWYVVLIHRFLGIGNINTFSLNKIGFLRTQLKWWPPFRKANIFINFRCVQIGRFYFPTYVFQWHIVWRNPHTQSEKWINADPFGEMERETLADWMGVLCVWEIFTIL